MDAKHVPWAASTELNSAINESWKRCQKSFVKESEMDTQILNMYVLPFYGWQSSVNN